MPSRLWRAAAILAPGLLLASLGAAGSATAATTGAPTLGVGKRVTSAASTSSRAAPGGPIPCRVVSVVPVAASSSYSSLPAAFLRW
jgi:hypothetical protein